MRVFIAGEIANLVRARSNTFRTPFFSSSFLEGWILSPPHLPSSCRARFISFLSRRRRDGFAKKNSRYRVGNRSRNHVSGRLTFLGIELFFLGVVNFFKERSNFDRFNVKEKVEVMLTNLINRWIFLLE